MSDLLRQPFQGGVLGILNTRKSVHNTMRGGGTDATGMQKRRLSSWAEVSIENAFFIRMLKDGYKGRYESNSNKPSQASLTKVTIRRLTSFAEKLNLTLEVDVEFEIFTKELFEIYAAQYLRRHPDRKPVTIRWGNVDSYDSRGSTSHSITGVWVLAGSFTNTELNTYKCSFKGIAAATALLHTDMFGHEPLEKIFPGEEFKYGNFGFKEEAVGSIVKRMMYDLQDSGYQLTKDFQDGYEPVSDSLGKVGKIYHPFDGSPAGDAGFMGIINRLITVDGKDGSDSAAHEYVSLEYIVALVNKVVVDNTVQNCKGQIPFKIKFIDNKHYSYAPKEFRSGNPLSVLFLGNNNQGNYTINGRGKDFDVLPGKYANCIIGEQLDHKLILISRRASIQLLMESIEKKQDKEKINTTSNGDIDKTILPLEVYFKHLFELISRASGGFISLGFSLDLDAIKEGGSIDAASTLTIIDPSWITDKQPPIHILDPIKGDGNCLNVNMSGKLPDDLTALALVPGSGKGSETSAKFSNDKALDITADKIAVVREKLTNKEVKFGIFAKMANDEFSDSAIQEACQTLSQYQKLLTTDASGYKFAEYFDVELKAEMEGVFPIIIGNLFTSTNLPKFARPENKVAFVCLDVEDTIEAPNIWTTSISCRLTPLPGGEGGEDGGGGGGQTQTASAPTVQSSPNISQAVSQQSVSSPPNVTKNAQQAFDRLKQKGYSDIQAAAIVGNLQAESGQTLNTSIKSAGSEQSFGIAQWNANAMVNQTTKYNPDGTPISRFDLLNKFAEDKGTEWTDLNTQVDFIDYELNTFPYLGKSALNNATTVQQATEAFTRNYERPSSANLQQNINNRINNAVNILNKNGG